MDLKNFFKPNIWKVIVFLALFLIYSFISGTQMCWSVVRLAPCPDANDCHASLCPTGLDAVFYYYSISPQAVIAPIIIFYALSCAIFHAVGFVKTALMPAKAKKKKE